MSLIDDLKTLSERQRRIIHRAAGRLMRELPTTHSIIIGTKPEIENARELIDFELIIFVNAESEAENKRIISESVYNKGPDTVSETSRIFEIYNPGLAYIRSSREISTDEEEALTYEYNDIYDHSRKAYLEFIRKHLIICQGR